MRNIKYFIKSLLYRIPNVEKNLLFFRKKYLYNRAQFAGWGLITNSNSPWEGKNINDLKYKAINNKIESLILKNQFTISSLDTFHNSILFIKSLNWRHYIIFSCIKFIQSKKNIKKFTLVECGVDDGISSFYAINSIELNNLDKCYLYDSWSNTFGDELNFKEKKFNRKYTGQNLDNVKKNLKEYSDYLIYNKGTIPESFKKSVNPDSIDFLHIDINSSNATKSILEFFYDKLNENSIILFDDYGWKNFEDTKKAVDNFLHDKSGFLFQLPTGQAIYVK